MHQKNYIFQVKYTTKLAKALSMNEKTQVQYQQFWYKEEREKEKWQNDFFYDFCLFGSYRKVIRSCSLVQSKGANFQFVHKSIYEFLIAADLYEVLVLSKNLDLLILSFLIEIYHCLIENRNKMLTTIDLQFIQSGSNSLNILVEMKVDLTNQNFENIIIKNTSLIGGNFAKCNLTGSQLTNVNINGINLNGAQQFNCKWKNLGINDLYQLYGQTDKLLSVCFSPDGNTLASGSDDKSIRLWDVQTGQKIQSSENSYNEILVKMKDLPFIKQPFYRYLLLYKILLPLILPFSVKPKQ